MALSRDETALMNLFDRCGLPHDAVNLIDGMDRQAEQGLGGSGFDTRLAPLPRHRVIIGTSAVEMGVNLGVEAMISDAGFDARACLQRIGRVARGESSGVIFLCHGGDEPPRHPSRRLRFKGMASDRWVEYDEAWAETYLQPAHRVDDDGVHIYDDYRVNCLREQPEPFEISILTPYGSCPATIRRLDDARRAQSAFLKRRTPRDTTGHAEALEFVRATGLVIRE